MGAVVPILVLSYLSDSLGAIPAYVVSALIPVGWVLVDLFFVTRRFNFITGFLGLSAIVRGLLAFWFVDGALYAFKDSVGGILTALVFAGSLVVGRPLVGAFVAQGLDSRTQEQENFLNRRRECFKAGSANYLLPALFRIGAAQERTVPQTSVQGSGPFGIGSEGVWKLGQVLQHGLLPFFVATVDCRIREAATVCPTRSLSRGHIAQLRIVAIDGQPTDVAMT